LFHHIFQAKKFLHNFTTLFKSREQFDCDDANSEVRFLSTTNCSQAQVYNML